MFSMLPRSGFAPWAAIFPSIVVIAHPPPDCFLDFVPSVAMISGVLSWIRVARLSGYSVKMFFSSCFFHCWRFLQYSMNVDGLGGLVLMSCEFTWIVNLFWMTCIGCASLGGCYSSFFVADDMVNVR